MTITMWAGQLRADPTPPSEVAVTSVAEATAALLTKGYETYELLLKTDSETLKLREAYSVRLGRIMVATTEFADNSEQVQLLLKKNRE